MPWLLPVTELDDIADVDVSSAVEGDMVYRDDAGQWVLVSGTKSDGTVPTIQADGTVAWETPSGGGGGSSPLTTKGDLWGFSTVDARIPVGSNDQVLTADSAQTLGVKWATPSGGGGSGGNLVHQALSDSAITINNTTPVSIVTHDVTGVAAGDVLYAKVYGKLVNATGGGRAYRFRPDFDSAFAAGDTASSSLSSTVQPRGFMIEWALVVIDSSTARMWAKYVVNLGVITPGDWANSQAYGALMDEASADLTGTITVSFAIASSSATGTEQEFTPWAFQIWHYPA